jgi:hypothetical protein
VTQLKSIRIGDDTTNGRVRDTADPSTLLASGAEQKDTHIGLNSDRIIAIEIGSTTASYTAIGNESAWRRRIE